MVRHGATWDDAHAWAQAHADDQGHTYVHPFDAIPVIEGQATLGLELLDDVADLDAVVIAVGGGGLIGGVAAAIKQVRSAVRVIGVEPVGAASLHDSLRAGHLVTLPTVQTIADTLAPRAVSEQTRLLAERYVDDVVLVEDARLVQGMRWLWAEANQIVEPAGAAVIAALQVYPRLLEGSVRAVAVICGGNAAANSIFDAYDAAIARSREA